MSACPTKKYDYDYYEQQRGPLLVGPLPHYRVGSLWAPDMNFPGVYDRTLADIGYRLQWPVNEKEKSSE